MAQHYRDARITTIYEGTTAIQSNDLIGRKLVRDKGQAMAVILSEIEHTVTVLHSQDQLSSMAFDLESGVNNLRLAVDAILENANTSVDYLGSVSVNFLMLSGTVFGAWQMCLAALAVHDDADVSDTFKATKLATSHFYLKHVLPRASSYLDAIIHGHDSVMNIPIEQL